MPNVALIEGNEQEGGDGGVDKGQDDGFLNSNHDGNELAN